MHLTLRNEMEIFHSETTKNLIHLEWINDIMKKITFTKREWHSLDKVDVVLQINIAKNTQEIID